MDNLLKLQKHTYFDRFIKTTDGMNSSGIPLVTVKTKEIPHLGCYYIRLSHPVYVRLATFDSAIPPHVENNRGRLCLGTFDGAYQDARFHYNFTTMFEYAIGAMLSYDETTEGPYSHVYPWQTHSRNLRKNQLDRQNEIWKAETSKLVKGGTGRYVAT
jgi:hypothetical protein